MCNSNYPCCLKLSDSADGPADNATPITVAEPIKLYVCNFLFILFFFVVGALVFVIMLFVVYFWPIANNSMGPGMSYATCAVTTCWAITFAMIEYQRAIRNRRL